MASPSSHPGSEDEPTVALSTPAPGTTSLLAPLAIGALVIVTLGGTFATLTVTFTTADVVERPRSSVATAVSAWPPMARFAVIV